MTEEYFALVVAVVEVHAVAFDQVQSKAAVPIQQGNRDGCRPAHRETHFLQAQSGEHFASDRGGGGWIVEQGIELRRRHGRQHALLEFQPQSRHGHEDRWPRSTQVIGMQFI